jgi:hypothetical protein
MLSKAILVLTLAAESVGCRGVADLSPSGGRPTGVDSDAAPIDSYMSPRRDATLGDSDLIDAAEGRDADASTSGVDEQVCNACEMASCRNVDGLDLYAACFLNSDLATAGSGAGMPKSELCRAVLHCARVTGCSITDPQPCYCGAGVGDLQCLAGQAMGPCKSEIEIAAESQNPGDIADRLADPSFASGAAFNLLRYCETPICGTSCLGPPPHGDAGVDAAPAPDAPPPDAPSPDAPSPDAPSSSCADLDHDGTPDCAQTLVANARFDHDLSWWTADFGATATRDALHDGLADASSGAIDVGDDIVIATGGTIMTGASQCIPAVAGATYVVAVQAFVPTGQGPGSAGVNTQFFPAAGCTGAITGMWTSPLVDTAGAWTAISGMAAVPANITSMRVRLVVAKTYAAPALHALFDNVLVRLR